MKNFQYFFALCTVLILFLFSENITNGLEKPHCASTPHILLAQSDHNTDTLDIDENYDEDDEILFDEDQITDEDAKEDDNFTSPETDNDDEDYDITPGDVCKLVGTYLELVITDQGIEPGVDYLKPKPAALIIFKNKSNNPCTVNFDPPDMLSAPSITIPAGGQVRVDVNPTDEFLSGKLTVSYTTKPERYKIITTTTIHFLNICSE